MYSFEERYRPLRELPGRRRIFVAEDQLLTRQVVVKEVDRQGVLQRREVAALLRLELPERAQAVVQRAAAALRPGGHLLVIDALAAGTPARELVRAV
ncbi:MAG TPA: hypothetical protein PKY30_23935, partial [Myxococcota bacterium]|nr:hypothetical protein [Myxococcota bacterium]